MKSVAAENRSEMQNLDRDVHVLIQKTDQDEQLFGDSINGFWYRSESLADRALDHQVAAWEKFQSTGPDSKYLIEAKQHVADAEVYEFTTGDKQKSGTELEKVKSYVEEAVPHVNGKAKPELEQVEKELAVAKTEIGKNQPGQRERYSAIKNTLSSLIR